MTNLWWGLAAAAAFEAVTVLFRFGLGMKSTRDTRWLRHWTFGYRIHHGYIGILLLVLAMLVPLPKQIFDLAVITGIALAVSDFVHHFLVLWPVTGSPEFDIRYPDDE
jgi:flagellar biosynthesis component FlhA